MIGDKLQIAIDTNAEIEISYMKNNGEVSERRLSEIQYVSENDHSQINAFCHLRKERRNFRIDRIQNLEIVEGTNNAKPTAPEKKEKVPYQFNPSKPIFKLYGIEY